MSILDLSEPHHAYFFGFVQCDGHLSQTTRRRGRVSVELSAQDEWLLQRFTELFPVRSQVTRRRRTTNFGPHSSAIWTAHDLSFRRELVDLGLPAGAKSRSVRPPPGDLAVTHYLRGLTDADGSVGLTAAGRPFVSFTTASPHLARFWCDQVQQLTGAIRRSRPNARDGVHNLMVASDPAATLARVLYGGDRDLALPRKRASACDVMCWQRPATMRARPRGRRPWTPDDDVVALEGTVAEAATRLDRTVGSVSARRWRLLGQGSPATT